MAEILIKKIKKIKYTYQNLSVVVKASIWFVFCNFFLKGISFVTSPLFAWLLPVDEYGGMTVFNTYKQVIVIIATLELSQGAYQRGLLKFKDDISYFTKSTVLLSTIITVVLYLLCLPFLDILCSLLEIDRTIWNILFVYLLVFPAYNCWLVSNRMEYKYRSAVIATILFSVIPTVGTLACVSILSATAKMQVCSNMIIVSLCYLPFYITYFRPHEIFANFKKTVNQWKYELKYQLPLVPHSLSYLILGQADRVMINAMVGKTEVALYSVSSTISMAVTIFQTSINQSFLPWCYHQMEAKNYKSIRKVGTAILVLIAGFILLCILIAPELIYLLYPNEYMESVWVIPPIMLSVYFMFLYSLFVNIETYFEKTKYIMYVSIFCAVVNICLNYFALLNFNYIWCGYTTLISYILFSIGHFYFYRKVCKEMINGEHIFNLRSILVISITLSIFVIIITVFYEARFVRYMLALLLIALAIICRNRILKIIASLRLQK